MAEAYTLWEGLCLAQHIGCNNFFIQSDNSEVTETIQDGGFCSTSSAAIFYDCAIPATSFTKVEFIHSQREANSVAHEIARHSFKIFDSCI
jgi:hypothetical protein